MHLDLFHELANPPHLARSEARAIDDWLDEWTLADALGFHGGWLVEHHFMRGYSHASKPEILLAAAAARTQRLRLGLGIIPAPYHHPVHIAEKVATLDLVSHGRLEVGLGRGFSPAEYAAFGVSMADSQRLTDDALQVLRLAFQRRPFSFQGQQLTLDHVDVVPHPLQQPHPPLWRAAVSGDSFDIAARDEVGVLAGPFKPWFMTRADIARYRQNWRHASAPRVGMTLGLLCLPDGKRAKALAKPAFEWFYRELYRVTLPVLEKQYPSYEALHELGRFRALLAYGINAGLLQSFDMAIAGSPAECIEALGKFRDAGVTHCLLAIGAGAVATEIARESMHCIAEDVMPALRGPKTEA